MTQDKAAHADQNWRTSTGSNLALTHYALLGLTPLVSTQEIRRAYRELSKLYHPDTTDLPAAIAIQKFQQLNEAYATLSSPERRLAYDQKIGYAQVQVVQSPQNLRPTVSQARSVKAPSAYLDSQDLRPLSPGELFALFILGVTFVACLVLAITVGLTRSETVFHPPLSSSPAIMQPAATSSDDQRVENDHQSVKGQLLVPVDQAQDSSTNNQNNDLSLPIESNQSDNGINAPILP